MDTHNEYTPDQPEVPNLDLDIANGLSDDAESDLSNCYGATCERLLYGYD